MTLSAIEKEALGLGPEERARLAHRPLASLDDLSAEDLDAKVRKLTD